MDLDRLRLIMETLAALGGDAKQAVIWYFTLHYGTHVLTWALGITGAIIVVRTVFHGIKAVNAVELRKEVEKSNTLNAFMQVARLLNIEHRIYVREHAVDTDSDGVTLIVNAVQQKVYDLKAAKDELDKARRELGELRAANSKLKIDVELARTGVK